MDRIGEPAATGARITPRVLPEQDPAAFVTSKLYSNPPTYVAVAPLDLPGAPAQQILQACGRRLCGASGAPGVVLGDRRAT